MYTLVLFYQLNYNFNKIPNFTHNLQVMHRLKYYNFDYYFHYNLMYKIVM